MTDTQEPREVIGIHDRRGLEVWLQVFRPELEERRLVTTIVETILSIEHPEWGEDWGPWLREHLQRIVERF